MPVDLRHHFNYYSKEEFNVSAITEWSFPCQINGAFKHFSFQFEGTTSVGDDYDTHESHETVSEHKLEIRNIRPAFDYAVHCSVVTEHSKSEEAVLRFKTDESREY